MTHKWKIYFCCHKGEKCDEIAKGHFSKITETARWEPPRKAAYTEHFNSYSFNFKGGLLYPPYWLLSVPRSVPGRRAVSVIFETSSPTFLTFCINYGNLWFYLILVFFYSSKRKYFEMCLVRSIFANLGPIMIHLNALDFNVPCSVALKKW